jgi:hypothetical protein
MRNKDSKKKHTNIKCKKKMGEIDYSKIDVRTPREKARKIDHAACLMHYNKLREARPDLKPTRLYYVVAGLCGISPQTVYRIVKAQC